MRTCAMVGCSNSDYKLEKMWKMECAKHKVIMGKDGCDCKAPFRLLPFPLEKTDPKLRALWTKMVNRMEPGSAKKWTPREQSRICTDHFHPGCPYPTLKLGYKAKSLKGRPERRGRKIVAGSRCFPKKLRRAEAPSPIPADYNSLSPLRLPANSDTESDNETLARPLVPQAVSDHNYVAVSTSSCEGCAHKQQVIDALRAQITELENELHAFHEQLADDPGTLGQWRGCHTIAEFRQKNGLASRSSKTGACSGQKVLGSAHHTLILLSENIANSAT